MWRPIQHQQSVCGIGPERVAELQQPCRRTCAGGSAAMGRARARHLSVYTGAREVQCSRTGGERTAEFLHDRVAHAIAAVRVKLATWQAYASARTDA